MGENGSLKHLNYNSHEAPPQHRPMRFNVELTRNKMFELILTSQNFPDRKSKKFGKIKNVSPGESRFSARHHD